MSKFADPLVVLLSFQNSLDNGASVNSKELANGYLSIYDEPGIGRKRYSYVKIDGSESIAIAIFGLESPINGLTCFNVGYAVKESYRGRGLSIEAINFGIEDLKSKLKLAKIHKFYIEAVIEVNNIHSLNVAKKIFLEPGKNSIDSESKKPAFYFNKLILTF